MAIDPVGSVGAGELVARYCRGAVSRLRTLVGTAVVLLPLVRYGLRVIRTLML